MKGKKSFTLVKALLIVAILSFLVTIVVVMASKISEDSKIQAMLSSLKTVKTALEVYYTNHSKFPAQTGWGDYLLGETNRILDRIPEDSFGFGDISYVLDKGTASERDTYAVYSVGPDGTGSVTADAANDRVDCTNSPIVVSNAKEISGTHYPK